MGDRRSDWQEELRRFLKPFLARLGMTLGENLLYLVLFCGRRRQPNVGREIRELSKPGKAPAAIPFQRPATERSPAPRTRPKAAWIRVDSVWTSSAAGCPREVSIHPRRT